MPASATLRLLVTRFLLLAVLMVAVVGAGSCRVGRTRPPAPEPLPAKSAAPAEAPAAIDPRCARDEAIDPSAPALNLTGAQTVTLTGGPHRFSVIRVCDGARVRIRGTATIELTTRQESVIHGRGIGSVDDRPATIHLHAPCGSRHSVLLDTAPAPAALNLWIPFGTVELASPLRGRGSYVGFAGAPDFPKTGDDAWNAQISSGTRETMTVWTGNKDAIPECGDVAPSLLRSVVPAGGELGPKPGAKVAAVAAPSTLFAACVNDWPIGNRAVVMAAYVPSRGVVVSDLAVSTDLAPEELASRRAALEEYVTRAQRARWLAFGERDGESKLIAGGEIAAVRVFERAPGEVERRELRVVIGACDVPGRWFASQPLVRFDDPEDRALARLREARGFEPPSPDGAALGALRDGLRRRLRGSGGEAAKTTSFGHALGPSGADPAFLLATDARVDDQDEERTEVSTYVWVTHEDPAPVVIELVTGHHGG